MTSVFARRNSRAVSPVIGTILMVAVTVVLAAVLYVMVSGIGGGNAPKPPSAQLQTGTWGGNATVATYSVGVGSVQDAAGISPTTLKYVVAKADQTPCYSGPAAQNQTTCKLGSVNFTVNVRYLDTTGSGAISPGDSIQVTVKPATGNPLLAGKFTVLTNEDKIIGTVTLS